ncbi:MAG: DUF1902 domain-containing protein [Oscillospiraceae bacterium]|jgi:hypothetical protein|nr:DUF1902 domain-containing protein [Oscillospiraceae bacterium]
MKLTIKVLWDPDAAVWVAESEDVPGLVLESGSFDALVERLRYAVPEMLELNGTTKGPLQLTVLSERMEQVAI